MYVTSLYNICDNELWIKLSNTTDLRILPPNKVIPTAIYLGFIAIDQNGMDACTIKWFKFYLFTSNSLNSVPQHSPHSRKGFSSFMCAIQIGSAYTCCQKGLLDMLLQDIWLDSTHTYLLILAR